MTIQITKTETKDIEVPVPSFWKWSAGKLTDYTAIVDESTVISLWVSDDLCIVQSGTPETLRNAVVKAHENHLLCTETEFMEAYNKTLKSLSLQPELV
jgi:hypothetical protein